MHHILLVDTNPEIAVLYQRRFIVAGLDLSIAESGEKALQMIRENAFDAVLIELALPEKDGLGVVRELRENPVYATDLKIIVLSDLIDTVKHKSALDLRVNGFIGKSDFAPDIVAHEVNRYLRQFEEQQKNDERFRSGGVPKSKNKKVLLVEDEDVFADMFGRRLRDEGYSVDIAVNGTEGFNKATSEAYDLIITDLVMPGINGKELSEKLKEDARTTNVPVFLFSASVTEDIINDLRCDGLKCFMKTHVTPSELVREVNAFLEV